MIFEDFLVRIIRLVLVSIKQREGKVMFKIILKEKSLENFSPITTAEPSLKFTTLPTVTFFAPGGLYIHSFKPFYNGHFLLSSRRPWWRGLTVFFPHFDENMTIKRRKAGD